MGALSGGVGGAVTGASNEYLKGALPADISSASRLVLAGSGSGALGGAASNAVKPESYTGDSGALLSNWALAVGGGGLGGAAGGYAGTKQQATDGHENQNQQQQHKNQNQQHENQNQQHENQNQQHENQNQPPEHQASTDDASKPALGGETHDDKTTAVLTAADVTNPEGPKKLPPSPKEVEKAVQWATEKLDALPKEGHLSREREAELFASGKVSQEEHDKHQLEFNGMDSFVTSEAGKAAGLTSSSTPDEIIQAAHDHLRKLNESNYERVQSGEAEHPSEVSAERLKLAVKGNEDGERVPLTYKGKSGESNDLAGATEQMRDFQGGIAGIADRNGITDMQVVQVGSGTTGWKNNPMKLLQHYGRERSDEEWFQHGAWTPSSDTDLAVFSDQAKVGAMQVDNPINADYGIFKTGSPGGKPGFSNTDLGHDLYQYGKQWDQRAYDPETLAKPEHKDGLFDFKLNIGNDAFTTPPTLYTGPDRN